MLDNTTKKRIDDCRDILVGKLPDPKAQIEQITIGLIYKFMDDMDKENIDLGGEANFFSGEFEKYSWDKLFDAKTTATQLFDLYSEAIDSMSKNPNIPPLFREIFKNAYLPYRDPETLKMFLKTIAEFEYSHSEKLGDAFEYLLSVMGSQGDAGQFRTPRHIIDFLVAAVNPSKNDTILDPACGTAGFLISAYKYIKQKNDTGFTTDEQRKLGQNLVGYDISPDMVRLSLVNLFLHNFTTPQIAEYDTLSSEQKWDENFDVILANPPFMSPKGGIRPHNKFSISSTRSEVLFVDYISEHLNPKGKAGIIIPEGIIFQNGKSYKALRKMLVENSLYAVISLPAGVFQPYSGVKTSILLLDKELSKTKNEILFLKIENDGYNLGAQRNAIKGSQLEEVIKILNDFRNGKVEENTITHTVEKTKIAEKGEYNLSGERYKVQTVVNTSFPLISLDEIFTSIRNGKNVTQFDEAGKYRVTRIQTISDKTVNLDKTKWTNDEVSEDYFMEEGDILLSHINSFEHLAKSAIFTGINEKVVHGTNLIRFKPNKDKVIPEYISSIFKSDNFINKAKVFAQKAVNQASLRLSDVKAIQIPLPPLSIQEEIVKEIESYQKIIDGAKMIVENYKPIISIDEKWEMVELGEIAKLVGGGTPSRKIDEYWENGNIDWISCSDFKSNEMYLSDSIRKITEEGLKDSSSNLIDAETIILVTRVSLGKLAFTTTKTAINQDLTALITNDKVVNKFFIYYYLLSISDKIERDGNGITVKGVSRDYVKRIKIPLPPLEIQKEIVSKIEKEQFLVSSNKELIVLFEQKIKDRIARVWGE